jgi:hypothetical protein
MLAEDDCDFNLYDGEEEESRSNIGWLVAIRGPKRDQLLEEKRQQLLLLSTMKRKADEGIEKNMV